MTAAMQMTEFKKQPVEFPKELERAARFILSGDLTPLNEVERAAYIRYMSEKHGLDPLMQPFFLSTYKGKTKLYALKEAAIQLANKRSVSVAILSNTRDADGMIEVCARASDPSGRFTDDYSYLDSAGKKGEELQNLRMKAITKAKRRAVLAHCGLSDVGDEDDEQRAQQGQSSTPSTAQGSALERINSLQAAKPSASDQKHNVTQLPSAHTQSVTQAIVVDEQKVTQVEVPPRAVPPAAARAVEVLEKSPLTVTAIETIDDETGEVIEAKSTGKAPKFNGNIEAHRNLVYAAFDKHKISGTWRRLNRPEFVDRLTAREIPADPVAIENALLAYLEEKKK